MAETGYDTCYTRGEGWLYFAFVVLLIVGFFNVVLGLTLIAGDPIYVSARDSEVVVIGNTTGWGWVLFISGILEVFAGFGVLTRNQPPWASCRCSMAASPSTHSWWCCCPCWSSTASRCTAGGIAPPSERRHDGNRAAPHWGRPLRVRWRPALDSERMFV
jgi:hypothetical protein